MFLCYRHTRCCFFFFFNDTATTEIYTLSLHDALPICVTFNQLIQNFHDQAAGLVSGGADILIVETQDRKSTRLNSSHLVISYAVFCLKKKKLTAQIITRWPKVRLLIRPALRVPCDALI